MPKQTAAAARARPRADLNLDRWIQSPEWPGARFVAPRPERALCHCRRRQRRCRRRYRRRLRHLRWRRRDILLRSSVCSRASLAGGSVSQLPRRSGGTLSAQAAACGLMPRLTFAGMACFQLAQCAVARRWLIACVSLRAAIVCCALRCGSGKLCCGCAARRIVRCRCPHHPGG